MYKIGIIKEGKNPPDKRVVLTPKQCKKALETNSDLSIFVQPSPFRAYTDEEYKAEGITLKEDLSDCDILIGIKEVPIDNLIANKTYLFFSHTIKMQKHNKKLLQSILEKKIKLIDYEVITDLESRRLIAFGKYAGLVGTYNAFRGWGLKNNTFDLKRPEDCFDKVELYKELKKVVLPNNFKIVTTGDGRVAGGALEILNELELKRVSPDEFIKEEFEEPVFTRLKSKDFYKHKVEGTPWDTMYFYQNPEEYVSCFADFTTSADLYLACHYWNPKSEIILKKENIEAKNFSIKLIADISCDIDGPIASTLRASTIAEPFYGYDKVNHKEVDFMEKDALGVMAVDNLPCSLPRDSSEEFGEAFLNNVLSNLKNEDKDDIIKRATIAENGFLTKNFSYLSKMLDN